MIYESKNTKIKVINDASIRVYSLVDCLFLFCSMF